MKLAVFDLDNTLLQTGDVDRRCYSQSVADVFGIFDASTDWRDYTHVTDSGITREVVARHLSREPSTEELGRVIQRFVDLLTEEFGRNARAFAPLPGAREALEALPGEMGWQIAIATGGWRASAELKLTCAGLLQDGLLMGTADDAITREAIVRAAIEGARRRCDVASFSRIVSIGDGLWDVRTAASLGLPFIGIGPEDAPGLTGVRHRLRDYRDAAGLAGLLDVADIPAVHRDVS